MPLPPPCCDHTGLCRSRTGYGGTPRVSRPRSRASGGWSSTASSWRPRRKTPRGSCASGGATPPAATGLVSPTNIRKALPQGPQRGAGRHRPDRRERQAPALPTARLPPDLRHRRHRERHPPRTSPKSSAATRTSTPRWATTRSVPTTRSKPTEPSSPAAGPCDLRRSTGRPPPKRWDQYLRHFEKRKLSIGTCARAFGTPCIHEHACVRCSLLRPDPAQRTPLAEIRDNVIARIAEAQTEGRLGEVEGLQVSLAGAEEKPRPLDRGHGQHPALDLGIPTTGGNR